MVKQRSEQYNLLQFPMWKAVIKPNLTKYNNDHKSESVKMLLFKVYFVRVWGSA